MEPLIKVKGISKTYIKRGFFTKDSFTALYPADLNIFPGQTLGIVGESGSGKTTLGKSILRLIGPTAGEVIYNSKDINKLSVQELRTLRKDFQIIFQNPYLTLNPQHTIFQIISEPLIVHKLSMSKSDLKNRVISLLEKVHLPKDCLDKLPKEFSGGQRQRISIARAIATNPKFIVCDECVSALDVSVQAQIINLLKELQKKYQISFLFISHDINVVKAISHEIVVMKSGRIIERGPSKEIFMHPKEEYTKMLLTSTYL